MCSAEWTEKYRPKKLKDVVGNRKAMEELRVWVEDQEDYRSKFKKAVILHGPPGSGKTSAAHALAAEKGWELIELNASDQRNEGVIKSIVGQASESDTFSKTTRLIVMDEADNIHGKEDRGGTKAITEIVRRTKMPIILIANDLYKVGSGLRQICKIIRFHRIREERIFQVLKWICDKEATEIEDNALHILAKNANGDLRSAINDLQAISMSIKDEEIREKDIVIGGRDFETSIFFALDKIFRGYDIEDALFSVYNLDKTPEEIIKWMYENLSKSNIYDKESVARSLHYLSRADEFLGRARGEENFIFWRYATSLMVCGVFSAKKEIKDEKKERETWQWERYKYQTPWHRRSYGEKESIALRERVVKKIAQYCKVPRSYAHFFIIPFIEIFFRDEKKAIDIAASLGLDVDEMAFLVGEVEGSEEKARRIYENTMKKKNRKKNEGARAKDETGKTLEERREERNGEKIRAQKTLLEYD